MTDTATTKKTVSIVDKAAKGIAKVTLDVSKIITELTTMSGISENLAFDIEQASGKLAAIESDTVTALRDAKADLNLRVKENEEKVLNSLLSVRGLAMISIAELKEINRDLEDAQADNKAEVEKAASIAGNMAKSAAKVEAAAAQATSDIAAAQAKADNTTKDLQIAFLNKSIATLEANATAERAARVEISNNASQPTINVSSGK